MTYFQYAKKFNKFGAKKQVWNGIKYDSGREAQEAMELDLMKRGGVLKEIKRQVTIPLYVNGCKICSYRADFVLFYKDGKVEIREVKGLIMDTFRLKFKLLEAILQKNTPDIKRIYEALEFNPKKHRLEMIIVR